MTLSLAFVILLSLLLGMDLTLLIYDIIWEEEKKAVKSDILTILLLVAALSINTYRLYRDMTNPPATETVVQEEPEPVLEEAVEEATAEPEL